MDEKKRLVKILKKFIKKVKAKDAFLVSKNGELLGSTLAKIEKMETKKTLETKETKEFILHDPDDKMKDGIIKKIGELEFCTQFEESGHDNIYISIVLNKLILAVIFDNISKLELVRQEKKNFEDELKNILKNKKVI